MNYEGVDQFMAFYERLPRAWNEGREQLNVRVKSKGQYQS